jgi:hypothetical protein
LFYFWGYKSEMNIWKENSTGEKIPHSTRVLISFFCLFSLWNFPSINSFLWWFRIAFLDRFLVNFIFFSWVEFHTKELEKQKQIEKSYLEHLEFRSTRKILANRNEQTSDQACGWQICWLWTGALYAGIEYRIMKIFRPTLCEL